MKLESNKGQLKHLKGHTLPKDKIIFWDTSFVIDVLLSPTIDRIEELKAKDINDDEKKELHNLQFTMHRHNVAVDFLKELIKENINVAFSSILFHEVYFALKYNELDKVYKDREITRKKLYENPKILANHIDNIMTNWNLFMGLLSKFKGRVFPITPSEPNIIKETLRICSTYGLHPSDSIHMGTILAGGKKDVVVFDNVFKDVALAEGLNVWYKV